MTNSFTTIYTIITKAAAEAGIRDNENYKVRIISKDSDMLLEALRSVNGVENVNIVSGVNI